MTQNADHSSGSQIPVLRNSILQERGLERRALCRIPAQVTDFTVWLLWIKTGCQTFLTVVLNLHYFTKAKI